MTRRTRRGMWLAVACCVVAALATPATAQPVAVGAKPAVARAGDDFTAEITMTRPAGLGAIEFELVYDPAALELAGVTGGGLLDNAMVGHKVLAPGRARCDAVSSRAVQRDGTLLLARFRALAKGDTEINVENPQAWDHANVLQMAVVTSPGKITIEPAGLLAGGNSWIIFVAAAAVLTLVIILAVALRSRRGSRT